MALYMQWKAVIWHVQFEAINSAFLWKLDIDCCVVIMGIFCSKKVRRGEWSAADVMGECEATGCWFGCEADPRHMLSQTLSELHTSAVSLTTGYNESVRAMFVEELLRYRLTNVVFLFNG